MVETERYQAHGNLVLAFATWVCRLHASGIEANEPDVAAACRAVIEASERAQGDEAGAALVERVAELVSPDPSVAGVRAVAHRLFGEAVAGDLGEGTREQRTARIRRYQFGRSLPWLARIVERHDDGKVAPTWLLVEQVTDRIRAMDPNPWNDIDETRHLSLSDFLVLWELDDCTALYHR